MSDKTSRHAAQASISDDTAVGAMKQEIPTSPKQRPGPWRRVAKYLAVPTVLLAPFVCWALMRTPPLQISKETTYLTEPLTKDGTQVDYFGAYRAGILPAGNEDRRERLSVDRSRVGLCRGQSRLQPMGR